MLPTRTLAIALLLAAAPIATPVLAQGSAAVTDADVDRAKHSQPAISDKDIERAQQRYRMPSDEELARVPVPGAPNLDVLPVPKNGHPIDLEALARSYQNNAEQMVAAQGLSTRPALLIFVSFSLPEATLGRLADQAARSGATLVLRGLIDGSLRATVARTQKLIGKRQVAMQIDPQAFDRFGVVQVPTFVIVRGGAQGKPCAGQLCAPQEAFVSTMGDVSLDYALTHIQRSSPRFAKDARDLRQKLRGV